MRTSGPRRIGGYGAADTTSCLPQLRVCSVRQLACETERVLITLNYQDFRLMEKFPPEQCGGILAVRMGHTGLAAVNSVLDRALRHFPESYFSRVFVLVSARIITRSIWLPD